MALNIKISNFEGPFDLLLHLIKKNEMDIYNIKIHDITNQYINYLNIMKEMDLEVTSEFIVVAATLIEIKSRTLLPKEKSKEEDDGVDPKAQLIERLIEYRKIKAATDYFRKLRNDSGIFFSKKAEIIEDKREEIVYEDLLKGISMLELYNIFNDLMNKYNSKMNKENIIQTRIPMDKYKIEDKMETIKNSIRDFYRINFNNFIKDYESKIEAIVTFLALLELIKLREVRVVQEYNFNNIYVERVEENEG